MVDPVSVALKLGTTPATGLLLVSLRVTVTVEVDTPSAVTGPAAVTVELAAVGVPAVKVTFDPVFATGVASDSVFISALRLARAQVDCPEALEAEQGE